MNRWQAGRAEAVDAYDTLRALDRVRRGLGIRASQGGARIGRYEIVELLGGGAFGRVYRAHDRELGREVAIKAVRLDAERAARARTQLRSEAQILARISHPNVASVLDVSVGAPAPRSNEAGATASAGDGGEVELVIVMELVRGDTLAEWVRRTMPTREEMLDAYMAAGEGLAAAHEQGVLHLDFKPANAMRRHDGRVVVTDFGLAAVPRTSGALGPTAADSGRHADPTEDGSTVARAGTPAYMPPEQHVGLPVTQTADVYTFAASLYEALLRRRPFTGQTALEMWRDKLRGAPSLKASGLDTRVASVLERAMSPDPRDRHPSMRALLEALARARRPRRGRNLIAAAVAACAGVFALAVPEPSRAECEPPGRMGACEDASEPEPPPGAGDDTPPNRLLNVHDALAEIERAPSTSKT